METNTLQFSWSVAGEHTLKTAVLAAYKNTREYRERCSRLARLWEQHRVVFVWEDALFKSSLWGGGGEQRNRG